MRKTLVTVIVLLVISNVVTGLLLYEHSEAFEKVRAEIDLAQSEILRVEAEAASAVESMKGDLDGIRAELDSIPTTVDARDIKNPFLCSYGDVAFWDFSGITC